MDASHGAHLQFGSSDTAALLSVACLSVDPAQNSNVSAAHTGGPALVEVRRTNRLCAWLDSVSAQLTGFGYTEVGDFRSA